MIEKLIPFVDLAAQQEELRPEIEARIRGVLDHGKYINGPEVIEFEARLAEFAGAVHAVGVSSGTDALIMVLLAKGIGSGDAVFVPTFTFPATAEAVLMVGAVPVFVEVEADTGNLDPASLETSVEQVALSRLRASAVIAVDLYGMPADYAGIGAVAERHGLTVIADAAQSFSAEVNGRRVGTLAEVTCTSFFPAKPLGCYGDGGAVLTDDDNLAGILRSIRVHGAGQHRYENVRLGMNARLDTLQAAILLPKLTVLAKERDRREELAAKYTGRLSSSMRVPVIPEGIRSAWAQYVIRVEQRDRVAAGLKERGIPTAVYYPRCVHQQPAYRALAQDADFSTAEHLSERVLAIPMHPYMDAQTAEYICDSVLETVRQV